MWTPKTIPTSIEEFLTERISFCENNVNGSADKVNPTFFKTLEDYKYCKDLYDSIVSGECDEKGLIRFNHLLNRLLSDVYNDLELTKYESNTYCLTGFSPRVIRPRIVNSYLSQETLDDLDDLMAMAVSLFEEKKQLLA